MKRAAHFRLNAREASRRARSDTYRRYCRYWRQVRTATTWVFFQNPSESLSANPVAAGLPNSVFAVLLNI